MKLFFAFLTIPIALSVLAQAGEPTTDIIALISDASGPLLMAVIIWGAIKEWWVPGRSHRRIVDERDKLLELAIRGTRVVEKSVQAAETIARESSND